MKTASVNSIVGNNTQQTDQPSQRSIPPSGHQPVMVQSLPTASPLPVSATLTHGEPSTDFVLRHASEAQLRQVKTARIQATMDLGTALHDAVLAGDTERLSALLAKLDPDNGGHYHHAVDALHAALSSENVPAARTVIDWLKNSGACDAEEIFPLAEQLHDCSDKKLSCLAEAGYPFSADYFPVHREEKTLSAIQDILFGKNLQQSPLSILQQDDALSLSDVWSSIVQCSKRDAHHGFDIQQSTAALLLLGLRLPVATALTSALKFYSPQPVSTCSAVSRLSNAQMTLFCFSQISALPLPLPALHSSDPLVAQQCQFMAEMAQDRIDQQIGHYALFFRKFLNCIADDFAVDNDKLSRFFREQMGMPDSLISELEVVLDRELQRVLALPVITLLKPGMTVRQALTQMADKLLRNLLCHLPKALDEAISADTCLAAGIEAAQRAGEEADSFMIYIDSNRAQVKKFCQQMRILTESGNVETVDLSSPDQSADGDSDDDLASSSGAFNSADESKSEPELSEI